MGDMDCIAVAQGRERWLALAKALMNFGFHKMRGIS
jgi:hypothetical protein